MAKKVRQLVNVPLQLIIESSQKEKPTHAEVQQIISMLLSNIQLAGSWQIVDITLADEDHFMEESTS